MKTFNSSELAGEGEELEGVALEEVGQTTAVTVGGVLGGVGVVVGVCVMGWLAWRLYNKRR